MGVSNTPPDSLTIITNVQEGQLSQSVMKAPQCRVKVEVVIILLLLRNPLSLRCFCTASGATITDCIY